MKNRKIPFGYMMKQGEIRICEQEACEVRNMFARYRQGASYAALAKDLTERRVCFLPGEYQWNKHRVKRILEDERYCASTVFPPLITQAELRAVHSLKEEKQTTKTPLYCEFPRHMRAKVVCDRCGRPLHRVYDKRRATQWKCVGCSISVKLTDVQLMNAVGVLLDGVASYPDMVDIGSSNYTPSETVKRLEEKICRRLCDTVADKEQLKLDILAYTAKKYDEIDNTRHLSDVIQAELRKAVPLSVFFGRTVR